MKNGISFWAIAAFRYTEMSLNRTIPFPPNLQYLLAVNYVISFSLGGTWQLVGILPSVGDVFLANAYTSSY